MKTLLCGLLITVVILGTLYAYMNMVLGDMCGNHIIDELQSPNKHFKAVIFTRGCGATTDNSTQLSIIETADQLKNEPGNTFILNDDGGARIKAIWISDTSLTVYFNTRTDFTKQKTAIDDIVVTYEQLLE